jgi:hypothetical protein
MPASLPKEKTVSESPSPVAAVKTSEKKAKKRKRPAPASRLRALEWAGRLLSVATSFRTMNKLEQRACRNVLLETVGTAHGALGAELPASLNFLSVRDVRFLLEIANLIGYDLEGESLMLTEEDVATWLRTRLAAE